MLWQQARTKEQVYFYSPRYLTSTELLQVGVVAIAFFEDAPDLTENRYNTPLELGIAPARRGSISTAMRIARAKALKVASMMW